MERKEKVLVIEDESSIRKFITINLVRNGFEPLEADCGENGIEIFKSQRPSVVVLDIMLPGIDGFEVCTRIRKISESSIIIMLTAKGQDMDKITGLELGADDYMVKPFNPLELIARIRANLRRIESKDEKEVGLVFDNFKLDLNSQKFYKNDKEIELTPTELSIVENFMRNPGKAFTRDELLNVVWGENYFGYVKTVDVHIRRLREKIEDEPSQPKIIETVWGHGYRWKEKANKQV